MPVPLVVEADGSSRPCRGRDAGSALAPAAQTLLCWCSAYLYRRPLPPQLRTGGSWSASVGPKERDDPGEGRRALGEKAFSSDPRGSLGVSDPPAAAPPECAVAAVAAAKSAWAEHPAPHLPSGGGGGRVRRPRGGAVCRSLPTAARASPLRVGGGSRWAPPGVRQVGGDRSVRAPRVRAVGPRGVVSLGAKGGKVLGARRPVGPGFPSPAAVVRESLSRPPSPHEPQPVAACGHGRGRLARERDPQDVEPRGGRLGSEDGSVEDGWRKMGLGGSPALAAGPGRGGPLWGWPGPVGVPGVSRDRPRVWVAVGPRAGFPGGPAVFPVSLWSPDGARGPVPRPPPCVLAGPSPPLPASPPRPARATAPRSLPLSGAEPASPHVGVVPRPPSAGGVPEAGRRAGSLARVGDVGAAGARRESVLPGRLAALGCVSVAVGVSPREGAGGGGRQSVVPGVRWDRPCAGRPPAVRSRGGPWRPTRASPCPSTGRFEPCPSRWRAAAPPTPPLFRGVGLAWPHPVGAPLRLSVRLSPLAVCCLPGPRPGVSRFRARRGPDPLPVSPPPVRRRRRVLDEGELP